MEEIEKQLMEIEGAEKKTKSSENDDADQIEEINWYKFVKLQGVRRKHPQPKLLVCAFSQIFPWKFYLYISGQKIEDLFFGDRFFRIKISIPLIIFYLMPNSLLYYDFSLVYFKKLKKGLYIMIFNLHIFTNWKIEVSFIITVVI